MTRRRLIVVLALVIAVALVVSVFVPIPLLSTGEPPEPVTIGLPTLESGWREVDHFSGSEDGITVVPVSTQDRWRVIFSAAGEPDGIAELNLEVPGAAPGGLPLEWTATFTGKTFQDTADWRAPLGEYSIVIETENIAAWAIRVEERPVDDYAGLIYSLRAVVGVEESGEVSQPFFSVAGNSITVDGEVIQVFEYPDVQSADTEAATISPDGSTIGTSSVAWVDTPHFYKKGRMIVLYVGDTELTDLLEGLLGEQIAGR